MSDCRKCRDLMIEARYGELDAAGRERLERHLAACPECAAASESLRADLDLMDRRRRPEPGPSFWDGYWDRLSRRVLWESIEEGGRPSLLGRLASALGRVRLPRWTLQAAGAAALLLVGVLIGSRLFRPSQGPAPATSAAAALAPSPAVVQAENFIERSQVLLLGLVNYRPDVQDAYALDLDRKRALSRDLAGASSSSSRASTPAGYSSRSTSTAWAAGPGRPRPPPPRPSPAREAPIDPKPKERDHDQPQENLRRRRPRLRPGCRFRRARGRGPHRPGEGRHRL
ncbi:MAG: zf-HC2 domain-containing protein [Acidobacteria bacterium]|nr:zf-HC2 domain-containing protein [Acidobacteriota bacterium]